MKPSKIYVMQEGYVPPTQVISLHSFAETFLAASIIKESAVVSENEFTETYFSGAIIKESTVVSGNSFSEVFSIEAVYAEPTAYYNLNSDFTDSAGSVDGNIGTATFEAGKNNNAVRATDSSNTYVDLNIGANEFSMAGWFKFEDLVDAPSVVFFGNVATWDEDFMLLSYYHPTGTITLASRDFSAQPSATKIEGVVNLNPSDYHHFAIIKSSAETSLYINGSLVGSSGQGNFREADYGNRVVLANDPGGSPDCLVDELAYFDSVITQDDVDFLYNSGSGKFWDGNEWVIGISNPIAYYNLDSDATDSVGSNDGAITGATSTSGINNNAYLFGANKNISLGTSNDFKQTEFSFSVWVKPDYGMTASAYYNIFAVGNIYANGYGLSVYGINNRFEFWTRESGESYESVVQEYHNEINIVNKWINIVCTFNSTTMKIYVDGEFVAELLTPRVPTFNPADESVIGDAFGDARNENFIGTIDELSMFDTVLSQDEITTLYNSGSGKFWNGSGWSDTQTVQPLTEPTTYYNLNSDITDSAGAYDGTLVSGTYVAAKNSNGVLLDGANTYLQANNVSNIINVETLKTGSFTVSTWVYFNNVSDIQALFGSSRTTDYVTVYFYDDSGNKKLKLAAREDSYGNFSTGGVVDVPIIINTWHNIVLRVDSGNYSFYVDGVEIPITIDLSTVTSYSNQDKFSWGTLTWSEGNDFMFNGIMDELAVFNSALPESEIIEIYNSGSGKFWNGSAWA